MPMPRATLTTIVTALLFGLGAGAAGAPGAWATTNTLGTSGWQVQSTANATAPASQISRAGFSTASWLHVRPDAAGAPGTEVGALVQTGRCPNVFVSTNMQSCFGFMSQIGPVTIPAFAVPWWFRTDFAYRPRGSEHAQLQINGVVGKAEVWVNGRRVATQAEVQGAFTEYSFDVTRLLVRGANALALRVYPNNPTKLFTLDNVDWTQIPPDNNTGLQFPVQLHTSGALTLSNAHVVQHDNADVSQAALTVKASVSNRSAARQTGLLTASVTSPDGALIRLVRPVSISARTTRTVSFTPAQNPQLRIRHPQVWWPYAMGLQPLYRLRVALAQPGTSADTQTETFGIRRITTRLIGRAPIAPQGSRQFLVNGVPFVFRAGGWSEDLFLRYSPSDTAAQIALIKNLGLNGIRTEGKQMPEDFYRQMDRAGVMIDGGFQCCDAWQLPDNQRGVTNHDLQILQLSARAIGERIRNHPSVINFSWSDNQPTPRQERVSLIGFRQADFQEPLVASAEYKSTRRLGPSGEKEGPYDWVPPNYWYDTSHYSPGDASRTNVGGAWAFNSEASAGHTVPTLDSIHRFMSPAEQAQLWQNPDYNQYHANYEPDLPGPSNSGYSFGTLHDLDQAISHRYGSWSSLTGYVERAQAQNYETQRAEFEAYIAHSRRRQAPSTGVVYWQLNKGWPTLLWDLYNHDYDQAGSYFGAKKGNAPLHALYSYDDGSVSVANLTGRPQTGLSVRARVLGLDGRLLDDRSARLAAIPSQGVSGGLLHPALPASTTPPAPARTYFIELVLSRQGHELDRNVYWLSTQQDVVDWPKTIGNPQATMSQYADLSQLSGLPAAQIRVSARTHHHPAADGTDTVTDVTITNTSSQPTVGFFLRADVRRGTPARSPAAGDNQVLPIVWSDNDVTLWPGESETLRASYRGASLRGAAPVVSVSGWNVVGTSVAAG